MAFFSARRVAQLTKALRRLDFPLTSTLPKQATLESTAGSCPGLERPFPGIRILGLAVTTVAGEGCRLFPAIFFARVSPQHTLPRQERRCLRLPGGARARTHYDRLAPPRSFPNAPGTRVGPRDGRFTPPPILRNLRGSDLPASHAPPGKLSRRFLPSSTVQRSRSHAQKDAGSCQTGGKSFHPWVKKDFPLVKAFFPEGTARKTDGKSFFPSVKEDFPRGKLSIPDGTEKIPDGIRSVCTPIAPQPAKRSCRVSDEL